MQLPYEPYEPDELFDTMRFHFFRLEDVLKDKGMKLKDVTESIGVTYDYFSNLKRKGWIPKPEALDIAEFLGVDCRSFCDDMLDERYCYITPKGTYRLTNKDGFTKSQKEYFVDKWNEITAYLRKNKDLLYKEEI